MGGFKRYLPVISLLCLFSTVIQTKCYTISPAAGRMILPVLEDVNLSKEALDQLNTPKADPFGIIHLAHRVGRAALSSMGKETRNRDRSVEDPEDSKSRTSSRRREKDSSKSVTVDKTIRKHQDSRTRESNSRSSSRDDRESDRRSSSGKDGRRPADDRRSRDDRRSGDGPRRPNDDSRKDRSKTGSERGGSRRRDRDRETTEGRGGKSDPCQGRFIHRIVVKNKMVCPDPSHQSQPATLSTNPYYYY